MTPESYEDEAWRLMGRRTRVALEEMGATFIKLGRAPATKMIFMSLWSYEGTEGSLFPLLDFKL